MMEFRLSASMIFCLICLRQINIDFLSWKEQVTDISKVLQDITVEMRLMRETFNQQYVAPFCQFMSVSRQIPAISKGDYRKNIISVSATS